jgi:transcriptional regulator with XRE-family HTH domain
MTKRAFSADKLRAIREAGGLSQARLAALTGMNPATIAKIEQGVRKDPRISTLVDLADAMGVDVDAFCERV